MGNEAGSPKSTEQEIDELYAAGAHLKEGSASFDRLRALQQTEADQIEERFTQGLSLPMAEGEALLRQADELIKKVTAKDPDLHS